MIKGTLKTDGLAVMRLNLDLSTSPATFKVLAALIHEGSGQSLAWVEAEGGVLSSETHTKVRELCASIEKDMANRFFQEGDANFSGEGATMARKTGLDMGGLGEHVGSVEDDEAPSI